MDLETVKQFIQNNKLFEATEGLEELLSQDKDHDELWYLRGIISLKLKNYDYAHECFENAVHRQQKVEYYKIDGMAYMETYDVKNAIQKFEAALRINEDLEIYFFLAICHTFLADEKASAYFGAALKIDKNKTMQMARQFFKEFFKEQHGLNFPLKEKIKQKIEQLK